MRFGTASTFTILLGLGGINIVLAKNVFLDGKGKPNVLGVKECRGKGKGSTCRADMTSFNPNAANGDIIQVDLGEGKNYSCRSNGKGHGQCRSVNGVEGDMNTITRNGAVHGSVNVGDDICDIGPDAKGNQLVHCKPSSEYPDEADPEHTETKDKYGEESPSKFRQLVTEPVDAKLKPSSSLRGRSSTAANRGLANDDGSVLDVLSVWTRKAECRNSGLVANCYESTAEFPQGQLTAQTELNMRGRIDLAVSETNTAYVLSGVFTELRLVHAYRDDTYVESSSDAFGTALGQVRSTTDGIMDDVHTKRQTYGADIVAMIIDDSQYCGIAYLGPAYGSMFSVTSWSCATGYYSFGHEIGHNMGCNHDRGTKNACTNGAYNYGFRDPSANFRSILAYNCNSGQCDGNVGGGCTRVQRFSNPNFQFNGKAIGNDQNDNARRINEVKATIALYESSGTAAPTGSPTGSPTAPTTSPTRSPTKSPVPPTVPPTDAPSKSPSPRPTSAPVTTVEKYICSKNSPVPSEICSTGSTFPDSRCTIQGESCGNGQKVCWIKSDCPSTSGPTTPTAPTASPPTSGCLGAGARCNTGTCCNGCETFGNKNNRVCL